MFGRLRYYYYYYFILDCYHIICFIATGHLEYSKVLNRLLRQIIQLCFWRVLVKCLSVVREEERSVHPGTSWEAPCVFTCSPIVVKRSEVLAQILPSTPLLVLWFLSLASLSLGSLPIKQGVNDSICLKISGRMKENCQPSSWYREVTQRILVIRMTQSPCLSLRAADCKPYGDSSSATLSTWALVSC